MHKCVTYVDLHLYDIINKSPSWVTAQMQSALLVDNKEYNTVHAFTYTMVGCSTPDQTLRFCVTGQLKLEGDRR